MTPRKRKLAKPVKAFALVDSLGIDPAAVCEYRSSLRIRGSMPGHRIARVEIREVKRKARKRRAGK